MTDDGKEYNAGLEKAAKIADAAVVLHMESAKKWRNVNMERYDRCTARVRVAATIAEAIRAEKI